MAIKGLEFLEIRNLRCMLDDIARESDFGDFYSFFWSCRDNNISFSFTVLLSFSIYSTLSISRVSTVITICKNSSKVCFGES